MLGATSLMSEQVEPLVPLVTGSPPDVAGSKSDPATPDSSNSTGDLLQGRRAPLDSPERLGLSGSPPGPRSLPPLQTAP